MTVDHFSDKEFGEGIVRGERRRDPQDTTGASVIAHLISMLKAGDEDANDGTSWSSHFTRFSRCCFSRQDRRNLTQ